jgi:hypothetical protein
LPVGVHSIAVGEFIVESFRLWRGIISIPAAPE